MTNTTRTRRRFTAQRSRRPWPWPWPDCATSCAWAQRHETPEQRAAENAQLTAESQAVFAEHRGDRLMQRAELRARTRKPFRPCSGASKGAGGWAGDNTYICTTAGWQYLAVWIDLFSRLVVGWTLERRMDAALVVEALNRALGHRRVEPETLLVIPIRAASTEPATTAFCWGSTRSSVACPPRAAGIAPLWRVPSPP